VQVEIELTLSPEEELKDVLEKLGIKKFEIVRKSLDSRKKPKFFYRIRADVSEEKGKELLNSGIAKPFVEKDFSVVIPKILKKRKVFIVGSGPAGLFTAYVLASAGLCPVVVERGKEVEKRSKDVERFWKFRKLNENSNVQFGEGGAGIFSDGKLICRSKDSKKHFVYKVLVDCGAPEEILYESKPHIGTDRLKEVVVNLRKKLTSMGTEFRFSTLLKDLNLENGKVTEVIFQDLASGKEYAENLDFLFLAVGNASRDTFEMLMKRGIRIVAKPFAVGLRIIHTQKTINRIQYGKKWYKHPKLPPADYAFTYKFGKRGVFTFCMCPGGYVICAPSERLTVVSNGMSNYARDSGYANSAVVVQVFPEDFDNDPKKAIEFQRLLERTAFFAGGGNYAMPAQRAVDFIREEISGKLIEDGFIPEIKPARLDRLLPEWLKEPIKRALLHWHKMTNFFLPENATLVGVETRTSSPVRILRKESGESVSASNLFPVGEGAGYSGGIVSSAIDGINAGLKLIERLS